MPTTILDGETYEEARHRRFSEEAKVDERIQQDEIIRMAREAGFSQSEKFDDLWIVSQEEVNKLVEMVSEHIKNQLFQNLEQDDDYPEGFNASCGFPASAMRLGNSVMCSVINKREWDVACVAAHLIGYTLKSVLAEREACAKVCDDIGDSDNGYGCAAAIRARGELDCGGAQHAG